jgi:hypothetical protein
MAKSLGTGDLVPRPDPTLLTTEALNREVSRLEEAIRRETYALKEILGGRMDAADQATLLRLETMQATPEAIRRQVSHLEVLHDEKFKALRDLTLERFNSINNQFAERDIRTDQASRASSEALAAALQAAKELVGAQGEASAAAAVKSETSFTKQIDQIGTIISTLEKALDARITELKERIDRSSGGTEGTQVQRQEARLNMNAVFAAISVAVAFAALLVVMLR